MYLINFKEGFYQRNLIIQQFLMNLYVH